VVEHKASIFAAQQQPRQPLFLGGEEEEEERLKEWVQADRIAFSKLQARRGAGSSSPVVWDGYR